HDQVVLVQEVEVKERSRVGDAVSRDPDHTGLPGEGRIRVVRGAVVELSRPGGRVDGLGALSDGRRETDSRDPDRAEPRPRLEVGGGVAYGRNAGRGKRREIHRLLGMREA